MDTESRQTMGKRLGEGRLAAAEDAGEQDVRVGDVLLLVEVPGVVDERRARPGLSSDVHPLGTEARLDDERVERLQVRAATTHFGENATRSVRQLADRLGTAGIDTDYV